MGAEDAPAHAARHGDPRRRRGLFRRTVDDEPTVGNVGSTDAEALLRLGRGGDLPAAEIPHIEIASDDPVLAVRLEGDRGPVSPRRAFAPVVVDEPVVVAEPEPELAIVPEPEPEVEPEVVFEESPATESEPVDDVLPEPEPRHREPAEPYDEAEMAIAEAANAARSRIESLIADLERRHAEKWGSES
ncbi:hypothetical protein [Nocardioides sp. Kera G14]|uniref:hypothetical protein n=1 Tax=Nocardioides sp. Kera G14 TaxID=2884264 RepID=UPI001D113357|nr:hypothetical protein [Nocardioides sp. Kera G14]UDY23610.1 hypothetical protein LH076_16355 [Nocardioides sp. Kera G14]